MKLSLIISQHHSVYAGMLGLLFALSLGSAMDANGENVSNRESKKNTEIGSPLAITLKQFKVTVVGDKEQLEEVSVIKPGDIIEYQATYRNGGSSAISGVLATLPVPEGMEYLPASHQQLAPTLAATANGKYGSIPLRKKISDAKGIAHIEDVPAAEYRNLRWMLGKLEAGKVVMISLRAKVNTH